jgi:hypothetical protein
LNLGVLRRGRLLQFAGNPSSSKLDCVELFLLCQRQSLMQLLVKRIVADLLQDVGIAGFVHGECLLAVWTLDLVHLILFL